MSESSLRRCLWALFSVTVPVPFLAMSMAFAPALRLWLLTAIFLAIWSQEELKSGFFAWILLAQAVIYGALTWAFAWGVARAAARRLDPRTRTFAFLGVAVVLFSTSLLPIYDTPLSTAAPQSNLLGLFR